MAEQQYSVDKNGNVRPGVVWPLRVHERAVQLAHEKRCSLSHYMAQLVDDDWDHAKLKPPTDFSPGLQQLIGESKNLGDKILKEKGKQK